MFWAEIWKTSEVSIWKFSVFGGEIFYIFEQACFGNGNYLWGDYAEGIQMSTFNVCFGTKSKSVNKHGLLIRYSDTLPGSHPLQKTLPHAKSKLLWADGWTDNYTYKQCECISIYASLLCLPTGALPIVKSSVVTDDRLLLIINQISFIWLIIRKNFYSGLIGKVYFRHIFFSHFLL